MELRDYLQHMTEVEGSDLFLTAGAVPSIKVHGEMQAMEVESLSPEAIKTMLYTVMSKEQIEEFEAIREMNLAIQLDGLGRFRINLFFQCGHIATVIRVIHTEIPSMESLDLPSSLADLVMCKRGLVLVVGGTGSGKSTSLAAMINHRNDHTCGHIITIEDPIEFVHQHKKSIISQREVGMDTQSYHNALKNTLRQSPDLVLIGEIRTQETMEHALNFAETGHLCISTMHATNTSQALERILNFFPEEKHNQILLDLSLNLRGIFSQRLVPTVDGKRALALELMVVTPYIRDLIQKRDIFGIKEAIQRSENQGMQTFDMALYDLYKAGTVSYNDALRYADSANNLRMRLNLESSRPKDTGLSLSDD